MTEVQVRVARWVDDDFPGFVECELVDHFGRVWRFIDKVPVINTQARGRDDQYPQPGAIACSVAASLGRDETGREIVEIDTDHPHGIRATGGETRFIVFKDQLLGALDR
ncbi:hypothetical protein IHQ68_17770 [Chelatococcus sambhunathii]|uniref:Uncharacterized protein n=1 Tax=Chelatococcus sambhunathii TaxID=363953 RepID=A0ABU1DK15_9HYPH|nr:hypothetical protein [Chelatococcus sambhunathii]MDR4308471.1 hypothetical protein [Chelatococcus sambhunathii]